MTAAQAAGLYGPDEAWAIGSLIQNQSSYAELATSEQDEIAVKLSELAVGSMVNYHTLTVKEGLGLVRLAASDEQMRRFLDDPHSAIKPIPRAVLRATYNDGGSLISPDTLAISHRFALDMTAFNHSLRASDSQPTLRIDTNHLGSGVRMDYALTHSYSGMFSETGKLDEADCACDLSHETLLPRLILPVLPGSVEALVAADGNFYIQSDNHKSAVPNLAHELSSDLGPVEPRVPGIDLPTGNQSGAQANVDYVHYDVSDSRVSVEGPRLTLGDSPAPLAVGELSVRHALLKYDRLSRGLDDAELHRAIILHIADHLGLSLRHHTQS